MTSNHPVMVHPTADVGDDARIGTGTTIWHQAQIARGVEIGTDCTLGKGCYVGVGSRVGHRVKIGNHADIFGAIVEDDVMICPQAVLTEDAAPRATRVDGQRKAAGDWTSDPVTIRRGATVGAGARVAPGVEIGAFALVGIGSVVLRDVPAHALVLGTPARQCAWVCRCGARLTDHTTCPICPLTYALVDGQITATQ